MRKNLFTSIASLFMIIFLSGCSFSTLTAEGKAKATQEAFETAFAQITTQAFLNPTSTNTPVPTATSTFTPSPTNTPTLEPTFTFTPSPTVPTLKAQLLYVSTFPENKQEFVPNETFGIAIGFQNTGSAAWGAGSKLLLVGYEGEYVTVQTEATLDHVVNPGEKVEFDLWGFCSEDMRYQSNYFQFYSEFGGAIDGGYAVFGYQPK
jgi:hypothetical protein